MILLSVVAFSMAKADPLFPFFVDLIGGNDYISHSTFVEGYPNRAAQNYAPVSGWYQGNEQRVFSFLKDVLPTAVLETRTEGEREDCKYYTYRSPYYDGEMISFLTVVVYKDNTIGVEYIEAYDPEYKKP